MTQWNKHFGCHRGVNRRSVRPLSVALTGVYSLPRASMDIGVTGAPSGPPG